MTQHWYYTGEKGARDGDHYSLKANVSGSLNEVGSDFEVETSEFPKVAWLMREEQPTHNTTHSLSVSERKAFFFFLFL